MTGPVVGAPFLPYGRQSIDEADIAAVVATLRGDWLTQGPAVDALEAALARRLEARHAIACTNGTSALLIAFQALDLRPGDAVLVPAVTFLATASAPHLAGAEIAFADCDPDTGLSEAAHFAAALERAEAAGWRVRACAPVHLGGQAADLDAIAAFADARGLAVVEDACHAVGGSHADGSPVGACRASLMATFSFHPVKTITGAEAGAVTTNDDALATRLRRLRNHGMVRDPAAFEDRAEALDADGLPNPWYYEMPEPSLNHRLSDVHAALLTSQLTRLDAVVGRRAALRARYEQRLAPLAPLVRLSPAAGHGVAGWHLAVALIDFTALGRPRGVVMRALRERGIGTQVHYRPVHRQPYWERRGAMPQLPGAEAWYRRALSLPLFPTMTDGDVDRVVDALAAVLGLAEPG